MIVTTINRMARSVDYPRFGGEGNLSLAADVGAPGTSWQNASYALNGMGSYNGTLRQRAGLGNFATGDYTTIGDYFTSSNYYLGFVVIAGIAYMALSGSGKAARRRAIGRANLKGAIARDQALL